MEQLIDAINLRAMRSQGAVIHYSRASQVLAHDQAAIDAVAQQARGKPILDLGVGAGRTVPALLAISSDYLGIDYVREMVDACQRKFAGVRFSFGDARSLTDVPDASMHMVVFSCNGICMVGHEDRLKILREVHRVLEPGGVFVFSTYNRNSPEASGRFRFPDFGVSKNPARMLVRTVRFAKDLVISLWNRQRLRQHEIHAPDFAMLNDVCHNYSVMLYYLSLHTQRQQLEATGFAPDAAAFDLTGKPITDDTELDSMAFIARKPLLQQ